MMWWSVWIVSGMVDMGKDKRLFRNNFFIRKIGWCEGEILGVVYKRGVIDTTDLTAYILMFMPDMFEFMY